MKKYGTRSYRFAVLVLLFLTFIFMAVPTMAYWNTLLYEKFEDDANTWPWPRNGNWWIREQSPPYFWWVERNSVFHPGDPNDVQSLWCVGFPNDKQPGWDFYGPNENNWAIWGPVDLTGAIASSGTFWGKFELEANTNNTGDDFYLLVLSGEPSADINDYDVLYQRKVGTTNRQWEIFTFDLDSALTHEEEHVSYLGREDVFIALYFMSDWDDVADKGVFIDDITWGYDDGEFDFDADRIALEHPDDPDQNYNICYVNQPIRINASFTAHGDLTSSEVDHILYVNDEPYDTVRVAWTGSRFGERYDLPFERTWTPTDTGYVSFRIVLDVQDEQVEKFEDNNDVDRTYQILPENHPPSIVFINPSEGGVTAPHGTFPIIYEAYNTPDSEVAEVSFLFDTVGEGFNGDPILSALSIPVTNTRDTAYWNMEYLPEDEYFIYAFIDDGYWDPLFQYAPGITLGIGDTPSTTVPEEFKLVSLYPNPFNPTVEITMSLPQNSPVKAFWYSVDGRQVDSQDFGKLSAGVRRVQWTPHNLPSGVYLVKVESTMGTVNGRVTFIK